MRLMIMIVLMISIKGSTIGRSVKESSADRYENMQHVAQKVLNDLYNSNGSHVYLKPKLLITEDSTRAAQYLRRSNKIELSEKLYRICQTFGEDSLSAMAFVIGHELAHVFQSDYAVSNTSFIAYNHMHDNSESYEESADVLGVFIAYLAGYKTMPILKELINKIYLDYNLNHELRGYPTLAERLTTTDKVMDLSQILIEVFEGAAYLLSIGKYEYAQKSYAYVENWFKGKEIYNNLGYCKVMQALTMKESNIFPYVFPFEIYWDTRMSKPLATRGADQLTSEEKIKYNRYLEDALEYFSLAAKMDRTEISAEINTMCTMVLQGRAAEAIEYGNSCNLELRAQLKSGEVNYADRYKSALAIALNENGNKKEALVLWRRMSYDLNTQGAVQAKYNLAAIAQEKPTDKLLDNCALIQLDNRTIDGVRLHRPAPEGIWTTLDETSDLTLCIDLKENSTVYTYKDKNGYFSLQRIMDVSMIELDDSIILKPQILTNTGHISGCENLKIAMLLNKKGKLNEWVKYY